MLQPTPVNKLQHITMSVSNTINLQENNDSNDYYQNSLMEFLYYARLNIYCLKLKFQEDIKPILSDTYTIEFRD